jgi:hypothetical protein
MKLAIIGSRELAEIDIEKYLPDDVSEIVSGGARGIDTLAREYAMKKKIPYTEFLPQYSRYGRAAPIKRNQEIAEYADMAIAFWDGVSKGTEYSIRLFQRLGKRVTVIRVEIACG